MICFSDLSSIFIKIDCFFFFLLVCTMTLGVTLPVFEHYQEGGDSKSCLKKNIYKNVMTL